MLDRKSIFIKVRKPLLLRMEWQYLFPFANIILSLIVAFTIGSKKHIGSRYTFFFGVGFTFVVGWIIAAFSTPLTEPLKQRRTDIYTYILCVLCVAGLVYSGIELNKTLKESKEIAASYKPYSVTDYGFNPNRNSISKDLYSYLKAKNTQAIWQNAFLIIGCLTTLLYFWNASKFKQPELANPL